MQNNMTEKNVWLIGAGYMAKEYAKVLISQKIKFTVIGRGEKSAQNFEEEFNIPVFRGGLIEAIQKLSTPQSAIITVGMEELQNSCLLLLDKGVKKIFVEKPAGMNSNEIKVVSDKAEELQASIYVAYNRRFFASVQKAKEIIKQDGGVTSFNFEFTEWSHIIGKLDRPKEVLNACLLANSSHVLDLAFYLGGTPVKMSCYKDGQMEWYSKGSNFVGAGITNVGALFSYKANWKGPGRWSVEIITKENKLILMPLEKLQIQKIGSIEVNEIEIDDKLDTQFKPGIYVQTELFFSEKCNELLAINEHYERTLIYELIEDGKNLD